jgi:anthranilate synthase/aminodeoxychorismate synthase-like glutamine amidotransferase
MLLLIDNYDSFVYNLARYFERLGQETRVARNDALDVEAVRKLRPDAIILSPGPCAPNEAGCSLAVVRELHREFPMLGVCLGHQAIGQALGGRVVRATEPMHGRTSLVEHDGRGIFAGAPNPLTVCRYHSLVVEEATLPAELEITARAADGAMMGLRHRALPVVGVQFHPESILTEAGYSLLANFLELAGLPVHAEEAAFADERDEPAPPPKLPDAPVTF